VKEAEPVAPVREQAPAAPPAIVIETTTPDKEAPTGPSAAPAPAELFGPHGMPLIDVEGVKVFMGREDDEVVWEAFAGKKDALMQCHLAYLDQDPGARDFDVALVLVITSAGKIREAQAVSTPRNPGFEVCILAAVMKMSFVFDKGFVDGRGEPVDTAVQYDIPITFTPAD
jgi:hypothetical protein